ncbi:unnamed protein product [Allacma fusca]|uniref:C2 domain-containing protein n=1 Tax=Allacma fusca TaxID=39272 RepID=A0A8J2PEA1_9HEXA|nr:unnamed protein product [Allacma fusca]
MERKLQAVRMAPRSTVWYGSDEELGRFIRSLDLKSTKEPEIMDVGTTSEPAPTEPPGPGIGQKILDKAEELGDKAIHFTADKTKLPVWGVVLILIGIVIVIIVGICFCLRRQWKKFKSSDKGKALASKGFMGKLVGGKEDGDTGGLITDMDPVAADEPEEPAEEQEFLGKLKYKLEYDFNTTHLTVTIIQAEELKAMDSGGTSDPYVKVFFADNKKKKFETKVHRGTLNPQFDETFVFKNMPFAEIMCKTLMIQVFDFDRFSKHDQIGEVKVVMCQIDLAVPFEGWKELDPPFDENSQALGEVCFSLRYVPTSGKLTVCIIEAKNLKKMDFGGLSDPFVKINLFMGGKKFKKKKTAVKMNTLNPYFNESFTFEITPEQLPKCHIILTILDYDRIGTCDPIGKVAVGSNQEGKGREHWMAMVNTPRRPIAQWHELRDPEEFKPEKK